MAGLTEGGPRVALAICLVAVLVLAACEGGGSGKTRGTTAPKPPQLAGHLAVAPVNCEGPAPQLVSFADYGNLVGSSPAWAGLYAAFDGANQRFHIERDAPRTAYGWRIKVLWVVETTLDGPAHVNGGEVAGGQSLWFQIEDQNERPAVSGTLDPETPGVPATSDDYREFPSYLYIPAAGCYFLDVRWPSGSWRLVFGLGR